jgi:hypothetical protein
MFDMSPYDSHDQNYIQVGIAPRNKWVDVGQVRYEPNFKDYKRENRDLDTSTIMTNFVD